MPRCPQCHSDFQHSLQEEALRRKIDQTFEAGPVPAPTHCPDCRMQRRMARRNERILYSRTCSKTGQPIISVYPADAPFPVYDRTVWWGDGWDALEYGQAFDFKRPFFEQFADLQRKVPRPALNATNSINCDYSNFAFDSKDCYLSPCSYRSEGLLYCYWALECKDSVDCSYIFQCEQCFECTDCNHCYNCVRCTLSNNCFDSAYLYDCRGCSNCFGCVGLRQKSYCFFNEPLSKEEYERRVKAIDFNNPEHVAWIEQKWRALKQAYPHQHSIQDKTEECTGDYVFESKNCQNSYQLYRSQDCFYVQDSEVKDCLDGYHAGWSQFVYESYSPVRQTSTAFSSQCWQGSDNFYSDNCHGTSHSFGCIGLRQKQYCILNRQYTKEEYTALLPKIVEHMQKTQFSEPLISEWGEFFPITLSPFAYNETLAHQYYPLSKEEVLKRGWKWREELPFTQGKETIVLDRIPQSIAEIPDSITQEILACFHCQRNYRIIPQELQWYRKHHFSLPRHCPECRYQQRMEWRNPRRLYARVCESCGVEISTTYQPDRSEKVFCEKCYLKAIY